MQSFLHCEFYILLKLWRLNFYFFFTFFIWDNLSCFVRVLLLHVALFLIEGFNFWPGNKCSVFSTTTWWYQRVECRQNVAAAAKLVVVADSRAYVWWMMRFEKQQNPIFIWKLYWDNIYKYISRNKDTVLMKLKLKSHFEFNSTRMF